MLKRGYKLIISVILVFTLFIGCSSAFASAEPAWLLRAKAGVSAILLAAQLVIHPVNVVLDSPLTQAIDPLGKIEWIETLPEYLDRSTVLVYPDVVVIDGVPYTDIWLGPDAANKLRLQGLDFVTAYNIANNQSEAISYASGAGFAGDVPIYNVNGGLRTQTFNSQGVGSYSNDISTFQCSQTSEYGYTGEYTIFNPASGSSRSTNRVVTDPLTEWKYYINFDSNFNGQGVLSTPAGGSSTSWLAFASYVDDTPFSFDYTSGEIDAPLSPDDGLYLRVPSSYTDTDPDVTTYNYDIHDLINIYPQVAQDHGTEINIDPDLNPDFQTDIDLGNSVGDLLWKILGILDLLDNIDIEFAPEPTAPDPGPQPGTIDPLPDPDPAPDEPTSGTTIADTDWTKLDEILRWIQSTIDSIRHITESLQTMLDSLFDQLQDIIQALQSLPEQLLEDIETGPSKVFRKALDVLKSIFLPLLLPIKAMMNLWHYVVEWVTAIGTPFAWIFGVMTGTSYNLVLPIYAALAGSICIAIYKSLGR